jgi:hypothetical protein
LTKYLAVVVDQPAADQRAVRLHPRRRAPRSAHHLQAPVQPAGLTQQRHDLRAVVGDRELLHAVVGLAGRQVVVGVVRAGDEVGGAHRLAQVAQAEPAARVEELAHDPVAVGRRREQRGRGVGDRGAVAGDALVPLGGVDGDRGQARVGRTEGAARLLLEQVRAVAGRQPRLGRARPDARRGAAGHR